MLTIALADSAPVSGSGGLLRIALKIAGDAGAGSRAPLLLAQAQLNDGTGRDFATSALKWTIERGDGGVLVSNQVQQRSTYLPIMVKR